MTALQKHAHISAFILRRRLAPRAVPWVLAWFSFTLPWSAQAQLKAPDTPQKQAYERNLAETLTAIDPEAAKIFANANAARDRNDHDAAAEGYEKVRKRVPTFSAATRRLCYVKGAQGRRAEAILLCREALTTEDLAENQAAVAGMLIQGSPDAPPTAQEIAEASTLALQAASRRPDDPFVRITQCEAAMRSNHVDQLQSCSTALRKLAPDHPASHLYTAIAAAYNKHFNEALTSLDRAHELGLSDATYQDLLNQVEANMPLSDRYGPTALRGLIGWAVSLVVLLGLGAALSKLTLLSVSKAPKTADGHATGADRWLRRLYRVVLWATCAFYYVSLPIIALLVLALGGGIIYGFLALGAIPIKIVAIVVIFTFVSLWAVVKSILARPQESEPGLLIDLNEQPKLREVLVEVAQRIGTRPVDKVYLTPGTDVAVFERGGVFRQLSGKTERCLVLGAGVLEGFETRALKAVLAHEYGHFHNEDTAGGGFALAVRRSVLTMALSLANGGAAAWYNPAWLFIRWFHKVFLRISHGASRLQEVLADRWAAFAYGADAFTAGLQHVIAQSVRFNAHTQCALAEVIEQKRALANLYQYRIKGKTPDAAEIERAIQEAFEAEPSPYDSHPSPADRFAWVAALPKKTIDVSENDKLGAWELFSDRSAIEKQMTAVVRDAVAENHGVVIRSKKPRARNAAASAEESPEEADETS